MDDAGCFTAEAGVEFQGLAVLDEGNAAVIAALERAGALLKVRICLFHHCVVFHNSGLGDPCSPHHWQGCPRGAARRVHRQHSGAHEPARSSGCRYISLIA